MSTSRTLHCDRNACPADRRAHPAPRGRAAAARHGPLRRRHHGAGRAARRLRAQPASACAIRGISTRRRAGAARRACGAHARRSRAGAGAAPHDAPLQFRHAARQAVVVRARRRRSLLCRRAGRDRASPTTATSPRTPPRWSRSTTTCCRRSPTAARRREPDAPTVRRELTPTSSRTYKVTYGDAEAAFAKAAHVFHEELWQHRGAAPSDRGPRHPRGIPRRRRRHDGLGLDPEGARSVPVADRAARPRREPAARRHARRRRRLRAEALRLSGGRRGGGGGEAHCGARSNGSRTGASISPTPRRSATSTGRSTSRSMPTARSSASAASCCTTSAPMRCRT